MTRFAKALVAGSVAGWLALPALAQSELVDMDGNGTYSYEEMTAAYPDMTPEDFAEIDTNGDGEVDLEELASAAAAGLLPQ